MYKTRYIPMKAHRFRYRFIMAYFRCTKHRRTKFIDKLADCSFNTITDTRWTKNSFIKRIQLYAIALPVARKKWNTDMWGERKEKRKCWSDNYICIETRRKGKLHDYLVILWILAFALHFSVQFNFSPSSGRQAIGAKEEKKKLIFKRQLSESKLKA